jgi:hypothetical protein
VAAKAERYAEERLLDLLLPPSQKKKGKAAKGTAARPQ